MFHALIAAASSVPLRDGSVPFGVRWQAGSTRALEGAAAILAVAGLVPASADGPVATEAAKSAKVAIFIGKLWDAPYVPRRFSRKAYRWLVLVPSKNISAAQLPIESTLPSWHISRP